MNMPPGLTPTSPLPHSTHEDYQTTIASSSAQPVGLSDLQSISALNHSVVGSSNAITGYSNKSDNHERKRKLSECASSCSPTPSSTSRLGGGSSTPSSSRGGKKRRAEEDEDVTPQEKALKGGVEIIWTLFKVVHQHIKSNPFFSPLIKNIFALLFEIVILIKIYTFI